MIKKTEHAIVTAVSIDSALLKKFFLLHLPIIFTSTFPHF